MCGEKLFITLTLMAAALLLRLLPSLFRSFKAHPQHDRWLHPAFRRSFRGWSFESKELSNIFQLTSIVSCFKGRPRFSQGSDPGQSEPPFILTEKNFFELLPGYSQMFCPPCSCLISMIFVTFQEVADRRWEVSKIKVFLFACFVDFFKLGHQNT